MKKLSKTLQLLLVFSFALIFIGCADSDENRYIVISTGGNDGQFPVFLDTKTRELFMVTVINDESMHVNKKSIDDAK